MGLLDEQRGFTLVEVLLATALLGILTVIVLSAMKLGLSSWEKGEARLDEGSARRNVFSRLSSDMASMCPVTAQEEGKKKYLFIGKPDCIGFATTQGEGRPPGGLKWVYYSVKENGLMVREKIITAPGLADDSGGRMIELEPGVRKINFEYMDKDGWEGGWNAEEKKGLPKAIKAQVELGEKGTIEIFTVPGATAGELENEKIEGGI